MAKPRTLALRRRALYEAFVCLLGGRADAFLLLRVAAGSEAHSRYAGARQLAEPAVEHSRSDRVHGRAHRDPRGLDRSPDTSPGRQAKKVSRFFAKPSLGGFGDLKGPGGGKRSRRAASVVPDARMHVRDCSPRGRP